MQTWRCFNMRSYKQLAVAHSPVLGRHLISKLYAWPYIETPYIWGAIYTCPNYKAPYIGALYIGPLHIALYIRFSGG